MRCRLCEHPSCANPQELDVRGIMRRVSVGNIFGARKVLNATSLEAQDLDRCEARCIYSREGKKSVAIRRVIEAIQDPSF